MRFGGGKLSLGHVAVPRCPGGPENDLGNKPLMKHRKGSGVDFTNLVFYFWQILKKTARSRVRVLLEYLLILKFLHQQCLPYEPSPQYDKEPSPT